MLPIDAARRPRGMLSDDEGDEDSMPEAQVVKIARLSPLASMPAPAHRSDAGLDLSVLDKHRLSPRSVARARTGLAIGIPKGWVGLLVPRSGAAARGLTLRNSPGIIDPGFTGEVLLLLENHSSQVIQVEPGERVAQLIVVPTLTSIHEVVALEGSDRGPRGFGSTGS